jgi:hypothetical protein
MIVAIAIAVVVLIVAWYVWQILEIVFGGGV